VKEWHELSVSVEGTPTLFAVDSSGAISQMWLGRLTPAEEKDVLEFMQSPAPAHLMRVNGVDDVSTEALNRMRRTQSVDLIDVRERSSIHHLAEGSMNIPLEEIPFRAAVELAPNRLHLVDCRVITSDVCDRAARALKREVRPVGTVGRGSYHETSCQTTRLRASLAN
jgi:hypothetical protein